MFAVYTTHSELARHEGAVILCRVFALVTDGLLNDELWVVEHSYAHLDTHRNTHTCRLERLTLMRIFQ